MDSSFISRTIKTSLVVGVIFFVFLSQMASLQVLWGGALGIALSVLNLFLLSRLSEAFCMPVIHHKKRGVFCAILKFPIFYGLLILLFYQFPISVYPFMVGFSVPLFVMMLKIVGGFSIVERARIIRSA